MKKIICAVISAALALSMVGCTFKSPATVLTVNGESISSGIYLIYQYLAFSNAANKVDDDKKNFLSQKIDDISVAEWINNETLESIKRHFYVDKEFTAKGLELTAEETATAQQTAQSNYLGNEKMFKKNGIGKDTFVEFYMINRKASKLRELFNADEANKVSDADAKKYMSDKFIHINSLYFPIYSPEYVAVTQEQRKDLEAIAKKMLAQVTGGKTLTKEFSIDFLKEAFKITGHEVTDTIADQFFGSDYISEESESYFTEELKEAMIASKKGEAAFNNNDDTIMVWSHVDTFTSEEEFNENKSDIISTVQNEKFEDALKAVIDGYTVDVNQSAKNTYSVKNVVLE